MLARVGDSAVAVDTKAATDADAPGVAANQGLNGSSGRTRVWRLRIDHGHRDELILKLCRMVLTVFVNHLRAMLGIRGEHRRVLFAFEMDAAKVRVQNGAAVDLVRLLALTELHVSCGVERRAHVTPDMHLPSQIEERKIISERRSVKRQTNNGQLVVPDENDLIRLFLDGLHCWSQVQVLVTYPNGIVPEVPVGDAIK